ncbi:MAG: hypothetical protein JW774_12445 [Candidatus Aureabacteria bacterium]|nr:hypothetical protein [Candidatus Auribacterota bacterium]
MDYLKVVSLITFLFCSSLSFSSETGPVSGEALQSLFSRLPEEARPSAFWWWFENAVEEKEITSELEDMLDKGLGGVTIYPVTQDKNKKFLGKESIPFLSKRWNEVFSHTLKEAERLGLYVDFSFNYGYPLGGVHVTGTPFGSRILTLATSRFTYSESLSDYQVPGWSTNKRLIGVYLVKTGWLPVIKEPVIYLDVTKQVRQGKLFCSLPEGRWMVLAIFCESTNQKVKFGEGEALDHFSKSAMRWQIYHAGGSVLKCIMESGAHSFRGFLLDGFEVKPELESSNKKGFFWSEGFLKDFFDKKRYELRSFLPELFYFAGETTPHVRYDYSDFLSQRTREHFYGTFITWAQKHRWGVRIQAAGSPSDEIMAYGMGFSPECSMMDYLSKHMMPKALLEGLDNKLASSASHLLGKTRCSAEAFTYLASPGKADLDVIKAEADNLFRQGVNRLVLHGYWYGKDTAPVLGRHYHADVAFGKMSPWWEHFRPLADYITRCSALLSLGQSVNPVAVYYPKADVWKKGAPKYALPEMKRKLLPVCNALIQSGYDFDFMNDELLRDEKIRSGIFSKRQYQCLIIFDAESLPYDTWKALEELTETGLPVLYHAQIPSFVCGIQEFREKQLQAAEIRVRLMKNSRILFSKTLDEMKTEIRKILEPDLVTGDPNLVFTHRSYPPYELYFVCNLSGKIISSRLSFAQTGYPYIGKATKGLVGACGFFQKKSFNRTEIPYSFKPHESVFVIFIS